MAGGSGQLPPDARVEGKGRAGPADALHPSADGPRRDAVAAGHLELGHHLGHGATRRRRAGPVVVARLDNHVQDRYGATPTPQPDTHIRADAVTGG